MKKILSLIVALLISTPTHALNTKATVGFGSAAVVGTLGAITTWYFAKQATDIKKQITKARTTGALVPEYVLHPLLEKQKQYRTNAWIIGAFTTLAVVAGTAYGISYWNNKQIPPSSKAPQPNPLQPFTNLSEEELAQLFDDTNHGTLKINTDQQKEAEQETEKQQMLRLFQQAQKQSSQPNSHQNQEPSILEEDDEMVFWPTQGPMPEDEAQSEILSWIIDDDTLSTPSQADLFALEKEIEQELEKERAKQDAQQNFNLDQDQAKALIAGKRIPKSKQQHNTPLSPKRPTAKNIFESREAQQIAQSIYAIFQRPSSPQKFETLRKMQQFLKQHSSDSLSSNASGLTEIIDPDDESYSGGTIRVE